MPEGDEDDHEEEEGIQSTENGKAAPYRLGASDIGIFTSPMKCGAAPVASQDHAVLSSHSLQTRNTSNSSRSDMGTHNMNFSFQKGERILGAPVSSEAESLAVDEIDALRAAARSRLRLPPCDVAAAAGFDRHTFTTWRYPSGTLSMRGTLFIAHSCDAARARKRTTCSSQKGP